MNINAMPEHDMPLDIQFNAAVMTIANRLFPGGWDVGPDAPDTLESLTAHIAKTGRMKVFDGGSQRTIFGCPEHNWAFRAWHDWHHWKAQLPFTPEGEHKVCNLQIMDLIKVYGACEITERWSHILRAEVDGQIRYHEKHGTFPDNQRGFVEAYLRYPEQAILERW